MKILVRQYVLAILFACIALILILNGCGGNPDAATGLGCPSGSILANAEDSIIAVTPDPADLVFWAGPSIPYNIAFGGVPPTFSFPYGNNYGPVIFSVQDKEKKNKNNICLVLTTDGFFWDKDYTAPVGEVTAYGRRLITKTDDGGNVTLWWSTEAVYSSATATGTTDGADFGTNDEIAATSGSAVPAYWNAKYTVKGCPVGIICP